MTESLSASEGYGVPSALLVQHLIGEFGESVMAPFGSAREKTLKEHGYRKLTLEHKRGAVNIVFHQTNEFAVEIFFLAADPPKRGLGTLVMELLTGFADEAGATLWLEAEPIQNGPNKPMSAKRLRRFYDGFSFEKAEIPDAWLNSYRRKYKLPLSFTMIRRPRTVQS